MRLPSRLPWWLFPWPAYRTAKATIALQDALLASCHRANSKLLARNEELDRRVSQLHGPMERDVIGLQAERMFGYEQPGTDRLDWIIAAADRGQGRGVRLYASAQLAAVSFRMTAEDDPPPRFQLRATFGRTDVVDRADAQDALVRLAAMWAARDGAPDLLRTIRPAGR